MGKTHATTPHLRQSSCQHLQTRFQLDCHATEAVEYQLCYMTIEFSHHNDIQCQHGSKRTAYVVWFSQAIQDTGGLRGLSF